MGLPGLAEADVGGADGAPGEQEGQTGEGEEPGEDGALTGGLTDEGEAAKSDLEQDTPDGTALTVDIGEELGGHTALGHGLNGTGGTEGAGVGDGDDGEGDDGVEDGREDLDAGILDGEHEGGRLGVCARGTQQTRVVGSDDEAEDEEVDDVEQEDAPKDLLHRTGDGLLGVGRLGGGETDQFGTAKGEGGGDEDGTEAAEAISERTWVLPVFDANVTLVSNATTVDDNTQEEEADACEDLDDG